MLENLQLAFQGVWNHKMRSFLTMLGIIIGIASIITIVSTIKGTSEQIKASLVGAGNNAVTVRLYQNDYPADVEYGSVPDGVRTISADTVEQLRAIDHVTGVSLFLSRDWANGVYAGDTAYQGKLYGVDEHYFDVFGYGLVCGRPFVAEDYTVFRKIAILDSDAAEQLFPGKNPLGGSIEVMDEVFTVIGVVAKKTGTELSVNNINDYYNYVGYNNGLIFLPSSVWPMVYRFDEPQTAALRADSPDSMTSVGQTAAKILTAAQITGADSKLSYRAADLMQQAQRLQEMSNSTNRQLLWIASISLLVGGIGVMNIMLVTVTERTREIGLKKAIGARKKRILWQFLTEAAVLTSLGGILGIVIGIVMARLISGVMGTPTAISPGAAIIALLFSTVIGVLFGLLPAVKASNLNPIDALRRE